MGDAVVTTESQPAPITNPAEREAARRWRLVLGRYAAQALEQPAEDEGLERALGYLYDREYSRRGDRMTGKRGAGSLDPSAVHAVGWLNLAKELFPKSTFERMQVDAVSRYELTSLLTDPDSLETLEPSPQLAMALVQVHDKLDERSRAGLRTLIASVVEDIVQRLRPRFTTALSGRRDRSRRSPVASSRDLDWRRTIAANLTRYDQDLERLIVQDVRFSSRARRTLPWEVVLLVDQSGSMAASLMYSAICASIMSALPGVRVRLILFDTSVVDLSHLAHDPVDVLMTAQLGGGTNIAQAVRYAEQEIRNPSRTVVTLISDFEEGGSVGQLLAAVRRLASAGVTLLGMAALDDSAIAMYDHGIARRLTEAGMQIAALTPDRFAEWLGEVMR